MARINVHFDDRELKRVLNVPKGKKRLAFGVASAINQTLFAIQRAEREEFPRHFTVRKAFTTRQVAKIEAKDKANPRQGRPHGEVAVGRVPGLFLGAYEEGAKREPAVGKHVAMPFIGGPARRQFKSKIPKRFSFQSLSFKPVGGGRVFVSEGTGLYLVPGVGVFRSRPGQDSEMVYAFRDDIRLDPRLRWQATAQRIYQRDFRKFMSAEVAETLRRHKAGGGS